MSMLESKSESFLEYIKSLQKGKGKVTQGLPRSAPHPSFKEASQESLAKIPEDDEVAAAPQDEPTDLGSTLAAESTADWNLDHSQSEQKPVDDAVRSDQQAATEEKPQAKGDENSNPISTNAPTASFAQPELQVTTRSMTTTGNNTQAATEISAATEVPAVSRMPSPSPTLPQATTGSGQSTPLLSNGSAFLQALPKAAKAFQPSMRGGDQQAVEDHLTTPTASSPSANEIKEGQLATSPYVQNGSDIRSLSASHFPPHPNNFDAQPSSFSAQADHISQQDSNPPYPTKTNINSSTAQPTTDSNNPWAVKPISSAMHARRYTATELNDIGKLCKKALFDQLVEMEGKGRVVVGIVEGA
ncbi:MAG: hypothetical protein Q9225_005660 [Loekoesia sp. 1 TL-2023]